MELNSQLVTSYKDTHAIVALGDGEVHNIFKLSCGLCHADRFELLVNGSPIDKSKYRVLLPCNEFKVRFGLDSISAVMLLDNTIRGEVVAKCYPIGGIWQNVNLSTVPMTGRLTDYYGHYLEDFGGIDGLESYGKVYTDIPASATDIDGILIGRTSYPGSGDPGSNLEDLEDRVLVLEKKAYHTPASVPSINYDGTLITIADRAKPLVQFTSDAPDVTWHHLPEISEIEININQKSGEITWVDPSKPRGIHKSVVYIMSNGVRSDDVELYINAL